MEEVVNKLNEGLEIGTTRNEIEKTNLFQQLVNKIGNVERATNIMVNLEASMQS